MSVDPRIDLRVRAFELALQTRGEEYIPPMPGGIIARATLIEAFLKGSTGAPRSDEAQAVQAAYARAIASLRTMTAPVPVAISYSNPVSTWEEMAVRLEQWLADAAGGSYRLGRPAAAPIQDDPDEVAEAYVRAWTTIEKIASPPHAPEPPSRKVPATWEEAMARLGQWLADVARSGWRLERKP